MPSTAPATTIESASAPVSVAEVRELHGCVESVMARFDVALVTASEAAEIGREVTRLKRRFEAVELACAKRVADTSLVRTRADHDGAKATGRQLGVSNGEAASLLQLAGQLDELTATRQAFENGDISRDQAAEIARTAAVKPGTEADLVAVARHESLGELKRRGRKLRANGEDGEEKLRRLQRQRSLRTWIDDDGAGNGRWRLPPAEHAELLAALDPVRDRIFRDARRTGRREPHEAYDADALIELARDAAAYAQADRDTTPPASATDDTSPAGELVHSPIAIGSSHIGDDGQLTLEPVPTAGGRMAPSSRADTLEAEPGSGELFPTAGPPSAPEPPSPSEPPQRTIGRPPGRPRDKVIFRIDWTAATRGHTLPAGHPDANGVGETCDIVGIGPVPLSVVHQVLEHDPFIAVVITEGTEIRSVTHLGRHATARMRTCLEWAHHGCSVLGCPNTGRLELDHREDWAHTLHTRLDQLDWLCHTHHQQKTHDGYRLEPGTGKRRFLPPPDP
jgi:hypothetical protein